MPVFPAEYSWHMACSVRYSGGSSSMKSSLNIRLLRTLMTVAALVAAVPAWADTRSNAREQVEFGINVAQRGLWREAIYRWEKAVELDPMYAAAYNDLGVAYEHEGQLEKARKAYEKALAI